MRVGLSIGFVGSEKFFGGDVGWEVAVDGVDGVGFVGSTGRVELGGGVRLCGGQAGGYR